MAKQTSASDGDRIDLGGKLPQFDAFAWLAYKELCRNNLEWIRIADPQALKLDDIQYSTKSEIHAYQVKWSNLENPEPFSYTDFRNLLKDFVEGWESLKKLHTKENKKLIIHLLSNRPLSKHDSIKDSSEKKIGSFADFYSEVWLKLKSKKTIENKWQNIAEDFRSETGLNKDSFNKLIESFELDFSFKPQTFGIVKLSQPQNDDLIVFSRFLFEEVGNKEKNVLFDYDKLIYKLNWSGRFKTTFNHELFVDRNKYQPLTATIDELNNKIANNLNGYLFLIGGPGSGKSTLLTEWSKQRTDRVIKYYAFDFTDPSSSLNYTERGESNNLFFDLVIQLKQLGFYKEDQLIQKESVFLREAFLRQLNQLHEEYLSTKKKTIIIIDGLDHVPREYKSVTKSFLSDLLPPSAIPEGIYIVLGSQTYELEDLQSDVQIESKNEEKCITISPLTKKSVYKYIESSEFVISLSEEDKEKIYNRSSGHPLYLSYLVNKLKNSGDIKILDEFEVLVGDISNYYTKLWKGISNSTNLLAFLALIGRIKGNINPAFLNEWNVDEDTLSIFRKKAIHLFDESDFGWVFFHNSFRQFLIHETSINIITGHYDNSKNEKYHLELSKLYQNSSIENKWDALYHLFYAKQYDEFINRSTPNDFIQQLINYRPSQEIAQDIKLGLFIAKQRKDFGLITRYLLSGSELERRLFNLDPIGFSKEFLQLKKPDITKKYLRNNHVLLCTKESAYKASKWFYQYNDKIEAKILYTLADSDIIQPDKILISAPHSIESDINILKEWASSSVLFESLNEILIRVNNIKYSEEQNHLLDSQKPEYLKVQLLYSIASSLTHLGRWGDLKTVLNVFNLKEEIDRNYYFFILEDAIEECINLNENQKANELLQLFHESFDFKKLKTLGKLKLANLIYKVSGRIDHIASFIDGINQPEIIKNIDFHSEGTLEEFRYRITYNKLLNLIGKGQSIIEAVPDSTKNDEKYIVHFERMLCLITQILTEGLSDNKHIGDISKRVTPIVQFYYTYTHPNNSYRYRIGQAKKSYFDFLIHSVSLHGEDNLNNLILFFIKEFEENSTHWDASTKRSILMTAYDYGFDASIIEKELEKIEVTMLLEEDVSGRIRECQSQVDSWIKLGKPAKAEEYIKQAIITSTGIGYRKDYQFNTWVNWLMKINVLEPQMSHDRLTWFASHLKHIKDTTEVRPFLEASEQTLLATLKVDLTWGVNLAKWQLENGLIYFIDAITITLKEILRVSDDKYVFNLVQELFNKLILTISETGQSFLLNELLNKGYMLLREDFLKTNIPVIIKSIKINAVEESRDDYYQSIFDFFTRMNIDISIYNYDVPNLSSLKKDPYKSSNNLVLSPNYESVAEEEVMNMVSSFDSLYELLEKEDKTNSYFNWIKTIESISEQLTKENLLRIKELKFGNRNTEILAHLSMCAYKINETELAKWFADKALEHSSSSGWVKYYDGGTKIKAFEAIRRIDPKNAEELGIETFCNDAISSDYPSSIIEHLDEIYSVIKPDFDFKIVWYEIEEYLKRLMINSQPMNELPQLGSDSLKEDVLLNELLVSLCNHPTNRINRIGKILVPKFLLQSNDLANRVRILGNSKSIEDNELFIELMIGLKSIQEDKIREYEQEIKSLTNSDHFFVSTQSRVLSSEIDPEFIVSNVPLKDLSPIYRLNFPKLTKIKHELDVDNYNFVKDTDDPVELIRPFNYWLDVISKMTGIRTENIAQRWKQIMYELDTSKISSEYEKSIRKNLDDVDINYAYIRPRVVISKRALMYLINELCNHELLDRNLMFNYAKFYDYEIEYTIDSSVKPDFIEPLSDSERSFVSKEWLSAIHSSERLNEKIIEYKAGWSIISEYSMVKSLAWGTASEKYMMHLICDSEYHDDEKHEIFGFTFDKFHKDYYELKGYPGTPFITIINDNRFENFSLKSHWLAFNPNLAVYLGWTPSNNLEFGWENNTGETMVHSIYWSNGNMDMNPPRNNSYAGEGWIVVASKNAIAEIKNISPSFRIEKRIERQMREDNAMLSKSTDKIIQVDL